MTPAAHSFHSPKSVGLRCWHWLNSTVVFGLLITVLVRRFYFSPRKNAALLEHAAQAGGQSLSHPTAMNAARDLTDHFWSLHIYLGYGLCALIVLRLVVAWRWQEWPLADFLRARDQWRRSAPEGRQQTAVRFLYLTVYAAMAFMAISGLIMSSDRDLGLISNYIHEIHEVHEFLQWYFFAFVFLHLAGVFRAELSSEPGLVSRMIHGQR